MLHRDLRHWFRSRAAILALYEIRTSDRFSGEAAHKLDGTFESTRGKNRRSLPKALGANVFELTSIQTRYGA